MRLVTVVLAISVVFGACNSDNAFTPPETICQPGSTKCFGNYSATCSADGKAFELVFCGYAQYCDQGLCRPRGCTPIGKKTCADEETVIVCPENGVASYETKCASGTTCIAGECLSSPCDAGTVICAFDTKLTCTGGGWDVEPCPSGYVCKGDECVKKVCQPEVAECSGEEFSGVCNIYGTDRIVTKCDLPKEHCLDGFCQPVVANPPSQQDVIEVVTPDVLDVPQAEADITEIKEELPSPEITPPKENKALINGTEVKFILAHDANWVVADKMLMINLMSKRTEVEGIGNYMHNLEIRIIGVEEGQVGTFRCEDVSTYGVQFWYRYGKYQQGEKCKDFDYEGQTCTVVIAEWNAEHVAGTFTDAHLVDCQQDGTFVSVTDGVFDVTR